MQLTTVDLSDVADCLQLNNQAVPNVNELDPATLTHLLGQAYWCRQLRQEGEMLGFLLALIAGADYDSANYQWFSEHADTFVYVDRIVVKPGQRSRGHGAELYKGLISEARAAGLGSICCEVNLDPPNPRSLAFHRRLGFEAVGEQATKGGTVRVQLLKKTL